MSRSASQRLTASVNADAVAPGAEALSGGRVARPRNWPAVLSLSRSRRAVLIAGLLYLAYALLLSWPLARDPSGMLGGAQITGDLGGTTAQIAYALGHGVFPFLPGRFPGIDAPQGLAVPWVLNWAAAPDTALNYTLGFVFGAAAGANVFLWLSFVLSGLSMFLLTRRLFGSDEAAGLAGFAFAFYPFAVNKIAGHVEYMDGWVLALSVWRMLELALAPSRRNALLAGLAAAFAMWFTPYFILIGGVAWMTMAMVNLGIGMVRNDLGRMFKLVVISGLPVVVLFLALGVLTANAGGPQAGGVRTQTLQALYVYGARWFEWLLPDRNNFLFGGLTRPFLASHLDGSNFSESSLYLGVSVMAFALTGALIAARRIRALGRRAVEDASVVAALSGAGLALAAAAFSAPPSVKVLGMPVVMPSGIVYQFSSTWRVYARFVELLELGLCILFALGVARLLARFARPARLAVFALVAVVLVVDLWARPPGPRASTLTLAPEYVWLRDHPGGIVADYPLEPADYPDYGPLLYAEMDGHPAFQGYVEGTPTASSKLALRNLRAPATGPGLAAQGVRYLVVHPGQYGGDAANLRRQGYVLRFSSPQGNVWQLSARLTSARSR